MFLSVLLLITLFPFSVFANGNLPVFSSQPSISDLDSSGIFISFDNNDVAYYGGSNSNIDYFYYLNTTSNQYMCTD